MKTIDQFDISEFNLFCYSLSKTFRNIRIGTDFGYIDSTFDYARMPTDTTPYFIEYSHGLISKNIKFQFSFGDLKGIDGKENQVKFYLKQAEVTLTKGSNSPLFIKTIS